MLYTAGFLILLIVIFTIVGFFIGDYIGAVIIFLIALILSFLIYFFSEKIILRSFNAKRTNNEKIRKIVDKFSNELQMKKPNIYIIEDRIPNSFVTSRGMESGSIAITRGILDLTEDEIEGVISHQIGRIRRSDAILTTVIASLSLIPSSVAQRAYWSMVYGNRKGRIKKIIGAFIVIIFAALPSAVNKVFVTERFFYRADKTGAFLSKKPLAIASALRKIDSIAKHENINGSFASVNLWFANPFEKTRFLRLFDMHPPIRNRLNNLELLANKPGREKEIHEFHWGMY